MTTFFWSDTHFNHAGIIHHASRPYRDVRDMNEFLIKRWNAVVGDRDTVWVLGDFAFAPGQNGDDIDGIFGRLNGRKSLVVGNHDERNPKVLKLPWERVEKLFTFKEGLRRAELCHYPLETWKASHAGALMLHGHSHGTLKRKLPRRYDVGADVLLHPAPFDDLLRLADREGDYIPQDHHGD